MRPADRRAPRIDRGKPAAWRGSGKLAPLQLGNRWRGPAGRNCYAVKIGAQQAQGVAVNGKLPGRRLGRLIEVVGPFERQNPFAAQGLSQIELELVHTSRIVAAAGHEQALLN